MGSRSIFFSRALILRSPLAEAWKGHQRSSDVAAWRGSWLWLWAGDRRESHQWCARENQSTLCPLCLGNSKAMATISPRWSRKTGKTLRHSLKEHTMKTGVRQKNPEPESKIAWSGHVDIWRFFFKKEKGSKRGNNGPFCHQIPWTPLQWDERFCLLFASLKFSWGAWPWSCPLLVRQVSQKFQERSWTSDLEAKNTTLILRADFLPLRP